MFSSLLYFLLLKYTSSIENNNSCTIIFFGKNCANIRRAAANIYTFIVVCHLIDPFVLNDGKVCTFVTNKMIALWLMKHFCSQWICRSLILSRTARNCDYKQLFNWKLFVSFVFLLPRYLFTTNFAKKNFFFYFLAIF